EQQISETLFDSNLLKRIPNNAVGFMIYNTELPSYVRFKQSSWSQMWSQDDVDSWTSQIYDGELKQTVDKLHKALTTAGVVTDSAQQKESISEGLGFWGVDQESKKIVAGMFFSAASNTSLKEKPRALSSLLKSEGLQVSEEKFDGAEGFSVAFNDTKMQSLGNKIFVAGNDNHLGFSNTKSTLQNLFISNSSGQTAKILGTATFVDAKKRLLDQDGRFLFAYADLAEASELIPSLLEQEESKNFVEQIKNFPIKAIALSKGMKDAPSFSAVVTTSAKTDDQKRWLTSFTEARGSHSFELAPSDATFLLSIDGNTVRKLKDAALNELAADQKARVEEQLALVNSLQSFGVGVLESAPSSPLPGVVLIFDSKEPSLLAESLKRRIEDLANGSGLPVGAWQKKEINGINVNFVQSPFMGVGLFVAESGSHVFVTSSLEASQAVIQTVKGQDKNLLNSISTSGQKILTTGAPLLTAHTNFMRLADTMESLQGSLAAFSGGAQTGEQERIDMMKKLGSLSISLAYEDGAFKLGSLFEAAPKEG
ncbi:MAG: hypothetical protein KDD42_05855, partial [Bdellovibrionales bacterium]|nr:hypothetical protein [Bdellovibrionales bacterium]